MINLNDYFSRVQLMKNHVHFEDFDVTYQLFVNLNKMEENLKKKIREGKMKMKN